MKVTYEHCEACNTRVDRNLLSHNDHFGGCLCETCDAEFNEEEADEQPIRDLLGKLGEAKDEIFRIREHGDEQMRDAQALIAQAMNILENKLG